MVATYSGRLCSEFCFARFISYYSVEANQNVKWLLEKRPLCATVLCSAQVFEGHPFIVEAGVSLGGKDVKQVSAFLLIS